MRTLVDFLLEKKKRQKKYFKNYLFWAKKIKEQAEKNIGKVEVFLFGSIIKTNIDSGSDIDILIISSKLQNSEKKAKLGLKF